MLLKIRIEVELKYGFVAIYHKYHPYLYSLALRYSLNLHQRMSKNREAS